MKNFDRQSDNFASRTPPSHGVFPVKLIHFGIVRAPGRLDPKREPVFAMQP